MQNCELLIYLYIDSYIHLYIFAFNALTLSGITKGSQSKNPTLAIPMFSIGNLEIVNLTNECIEK